MTQLRLCTHWWMYEPQNGVKSKATCRYCGATREDYNAFPDELEKMFNNRIPPKKVLMRSVANNIDTFLEGVRHGKHPTRDFRYIEEY